MLKKEPYGSTLKNQRAYLEIWFISSQRDNFA